MDSLINTAARALAAGDAIGALKRVSLREDPPALALRGIAMAQLGDHARARDLLRRAARGFGPHESRSRARCVVAQAEVSLAMRELGGAWQALDAAARTLAAHADHANALQAELIALRRLLLLGRLDEADAALPRILASDLPPALRAVAELAAAELSMRRLRTAEARTALSRAHDAATQARVPALIAEVAEAHAVLARPAARRLYADGSEQSLRLDEVEALRASDALIVDACRRSVRQGQAGRALARRPLLFELALALAEAWPADAQRNALIARAFRTRRPDETHRARLRVEMGRLRALLKPLARIDASARGFRLAPQHTPEVAVLMPPIAGDQASLLALLADGGAWSTSALALALGVSQRGVQRALVELEAEGRVRAIGRGRTQRWLAPPLTGFTTILLLPAVLPSA